MVMFFLFWYTVRNSALPPTRANAVGMMSITAYAFVRVSETVLVHESHSKAAFMFRSGALSSLSSSYLTGLWSYKNCYSQVCVWWLCFKVYCLRWQWDDKELNLLYLKWNEIYLKLLYVLAQEALSIYMCLILKWKNISIKMKKQIFLQTSTNSSTIWQDWIDPCCEASHQQNGWSSNFSLSSSM